MKDLPRAGDNKKFQFFMRSNLSKNPLWAVLWKLRHAFLAAGIFSMVANMLMLTPTLYMLQVYDRVMMSQSMGTLLAVSMLALFLLVVLAFSEWVRSKLLVRTGVRIDALLSRPLFHACFGAYLSFKTTSNASSSSSPTQALIDLTQLRQFLTGNSIFAFFDAPWVPIYIAVLFLLHPWLGVLALVFAALQFTLAWAGSHLTKRPQRTASDAQQQAAIFLQSKLRNIEVIESMGMADKLFERWTERNQKALALSMVYQERSSSVTAWSKFIRYTQQSLVLGAGALLVIRGELSPGAMIAANVLMSRALAPIDLMVSTWGSFLSFKESFNRMGRLLQNYPMENTPLKHVAPKGNLVLKNVVATAPGREVPILRDVSVIIPAGSVTVVLGASGSGKSTLAKVMLGVWPIESGHVLLDDEPVLSWHRTELGPYVGYLPQDIELFEGTIAQNIARCGRVAPQQVIEAATACGLHETILRMPKGYDSLMGEAGALLSGGQRQRVALARALYGSPALVVLDEPNANLDDEGEAALARAVEGLKAQGKAVVLITHRSAAVTMADRILILHEGGVQASGPRDQVLAAIRAKQARPPASLPPQIDTHR